MSKILKKISILAGIFVAAAGIYFILAQNTIEKSETVYTIMEEPSLPVVYADMFGTEGNRMPGYLQEMEQKTARESLTVLPKDRNLDIRITDKEESILSLQYEIRSMDLSRLVEKTEVAEWNDREGEVLASLPIQNLLIPDTQYMLHLILKTEQHEAIHYYTRIMIQKEDYAEGMIDFAKDFSMKTLDSGQAQSLAMYLEADDTEDNSSLGHVTIRSSYSQLTWAGLKMELAGNMQVTLKELEGIMGQVEVKYHLTRTAEDGTTEYYDVMDYYTLKWNAKRFYLMDFERTTNQIFGGTRELYSGKRILLGVGNDDAVKVQWDPEKRYLAYSFNKDLWCYDQTDGKAVKVFSFRSGTDATERSVYDQHDVQIISVKESGDVNFLVYGYMNRGAHEGYVGVSLCRYIHSNGAVEERFFAPVQGTYESLKQDIEQLTFLNSSEMLYLLIDRAVYGIDLNSYEYMVVTDALEEGSYAISADKSILAWQEGRELYAAKTIHLLNLETSTKQMITGEDGDCLRTLGFVRNDFVYGLARPEDLWTSHGRVEALPMYALEIVDENLTLETRYEKPEYYLSDVTVEDARVHVNRLVKLGEGEFRYQDADTIVCNTASEQDPMEGIGWYASETRRKLYFVQVDNEIKSGKSIKISVPKKIAYDTSEELFLKANEEVKDIMFYAYGQGHLQGRTKDFAKAVQMAYDKMGFVTDANQRILWDRVNRASLKTIKEPQNAAYSITKHLQDFTASRDSDEKIMRLDARGCTLSQMLYFIDKGIPVVAYGQEDHYVLIYGFDQYNVSIYDPVSSQSYKMGLGDAGEYFEKCRNDFICGVLVD